MCSVAIAARAQAPQPISIDSPTRAYAQAHMFCAADAGRLWGVSLCGPIMFVDAPSRSIVARQGDAKGVLSEKNGVGENTQLPSLSDGRGHAKTRSRSAHVISRDGAATRERVI